jgi:hypothetical protein
LVKTPRNNRLKLNAGNRGRFWQAADPKAKNVDLLRKRHALAGFAS